LTATLPHSSIFVTGGTGFLGRSLVPLLVQRGYHVRVLTRHPEQYPWLGALPVEIIKGDVEDSRLIHAAVQGCEYVVHAAGRFSFWGKREQFERTNVLGAENVMHAALAAGVRRFVHVSTVVVVGQPLPNAVVDETHPTHPMDPYQRSKLMAEQLALRYFRERALPVVVLRPGAFYGPYGRYAFNRLFIRDPLKGLLIKVDNGTHITFPVYIGDVAESVLLVLDKGKPGEVYNICGDSMTHNQANDIVSEEAGITRFRLNVPGWAMIALAYAWTALSEFTHIEPYYPLNLRSYVFNNWRVNSDKARRDLGFHARPFRDGVRATLQWYWDEGIVGRRKR
jgi:dihydroflavonol-4-reductase